MSKHFLGSVLAGLFLVLFGASVLAYVPAYMPYGSGYNYNYQYSFGPYGNYFSSCYSGWCNTPFGSSYNYQYQYQYSYPFSGNYSYPYYGNFSYPVYGYPSAFYNPGLFFFYNKYPNSYWFSWN